MELYKSLTLRQTADLIMAVGDKVTVLAQGEMGIGKSSMLKFMQEKLGKENYHFCYVDMTTKDVGDFMIPKIRTIDGVEVCSFIPNEEFGFHLDKPVVIMLDEIGKAPKAVMNACLRLMLERQLGVYSLPVGNDGRKSIVFATTNLSVEGIGDSVPPHARNRITTVKVGKPNADTWIEEFALPYNIAPEVILTAKQFPQMFQSFEDLKDPKDNEYINDPRSPRPAVVTPRTMEKASDLINQCKALGDDVLSHALIGTIGRRATYDMMAMVRLANDLEDWETIIKNPEKARVPESPSAVCMLVYSAVQRVDKESVNAWIKYMNRLGKEAQALFATSVMRVSSKASTVGTSRGFIDWATKNNYLFTNMS
jgi:MoxR-like ATPase